MDDEFRKIMEEFDDLPPDPKFPDRPDTEEFKEISKIFRALDESNGPQDHLTQEMIEALMYASKQRVIAVVELYSLGLRERVRRDLRNVISENPIIKAAYIEAFTLGMYYQNNRDNKPL